jgi:hypothetical protein
MDGDYTRAEYLRDLSMRSEVGGSTMTFESFRLACILYAADSTSSHSSVQCPASRGCADPKVLCCENAHVLRLTVRMLFAERNL